MASDLNRQPEPRQKSRQWLILVILAVLAACGLLSGGASFIGKFSPSPFGREATAPIGSPAPAPTLVPFEELRATVAGMTEAQWKAWLPTLRGSQVEGWQGWVADVDQKLSGRYELWVDMDPPGEALSTVDLYLDIPDDLALTLNKKQPVAITGTVESVSEFLGSVSVGLADATVVAGP